jgi:hypothetical protein
MSVNAPSSDLTDIDMNVVLPHGSSGLWIVSSDTTRLLDVYGMLIAADPFGSLWMIPMVDILQDIQLEFKAVEGRQQATAKTPASAKHNIWGKRQPIWVWHCSAYGDEPYADWNPICQACAHRRCSTCPAEDTC